jgi:hypothetical protein
VRIRRRGKEKGLGGSDEVCNGVGSGKVERGSSGKMQWGVGQGRKAVQEGAQQGSEGKLRRKRGAYEVSVVVVGCCI